MSEYILYTGIGAKKSGKHTIEEFLKIMNSEHGVKCEKIIKSKKYNKCVNDYGGLCNYDNIFKKYNKCVNDSVSLKKNNCNKELENGNRVLNKCLNKNEKKYNKCDRVSNKVLKNVNCSLNDYIDYVGAIKK